MYYMKLTFFFRFMDAFDRDMVPNTSDDERRYSYEKQPDAGAFNLDKLGRALEPLLTRHQQKQVCITCICLSLRRISFLR